MGNQTDFDINNALKYYLSDPATVPIPEADGTLVDCENDPDSLTTPVINGVLDPIVDAIAEHPDALIRSSVFDSLQFLLKCAPISLPSQQHYPSEPDSELFRISRSVSLLPTHALSKILDVVVSGLSSEADTIHNEGETEAQETTGHHKQLLEMYGFLLQWCISAVEVKAAEKPANAAPARGRGAGKGAKSKASAKDGAWDPTSQLQTALEIMCKVMKLKLARIFMTTSERDILVGLFTRSVYLMFESEQRVKNNTLRMHAFKALCMAVKHHGHAFGELKWQLEMKLLYLFSGRSANFNHPESFLLRTPGGANGRVPPDSSRTIRLSSASRGDSKVFPADWRYHNVLTLWQGTEQQGVQHQ